MFMANESQRALVRKHGTLVARILIGALFLFAGLGKIKTFTGVAIYIGSAGLPVPEVLAALTIAIEIAGGAALIVGYRIGAAAAALGTFTLLASVIFHHPGLWKDPVQQIMFMKNLALVGGLIYVFAYGPGEGWSFGRTTPAPVQPS
jgi:putative oxidoreductase